jgi:NitT/TauT family transport system ATP-binding protein/nitrate/nitrite transport system substrate-binding protein
MSAPEPQQKLKLTIGFLRLTDAAPVIVAHELGFFADEGVDTELVVEPSWANIADKLSYGVMDAAVIVPPLAFAVALGLRGRSEPLVIPWVMSLGGNTVTLASKLANEVLDLAAREGVSRLEAFARRLRGDREPAVLAVVHAYSTHNLLLRYWLATAGIVGGRDIVLSVIPPAQAVEALDTGKIAGFCAGAPWGEVAMRAKLGTTIATSHDIWRNAPEKAFCVREAWAMENPVALAGALRALHRAAQFCDAPENASYTAALLSRKKYLAVDSHAIMASLPGGSQSSKNVSVFFRGAANFPFLSQAQWYVREMTRWDLLPAGIDHEALARKLYRPDLYRAAIAPLGQSLPRAALKQEGGHAETWRLEGEPSAITMEPDLFCDGAVFRPDNET